jgi:hypothetical protein
MKEGENGRKPLAEKQLDQYFAVICVSYTCLCLFVARV